MKAQDVLKSTLSTTNMVMRSYLGDLEGADMFVRPGNECNHIAWQLGHLLVSGTDLLRAVAPDLTPALPEGFAEKHTAETAKSDDPSKFCTKDAYLELFDRLDAATIAAIDKVTDSELDQPAPEKWRSWCPTFGHIYVLITTHTMMHVGQWVPIRRTLGKPIVM